MKVKTTYTLAPEEIIGLLVEKCNIPGLDKIRRVIVSHTDNDEQILLFFRNENASKNEGSSIYEPVTIVVEVES